jgi:hypothetical protein
MKDFSLFAVLALTISGCGLGDHAGPLTKATAVVVSPFVPRKPSAHLYDAVYADDPHRVDKVLTEHPELLQERHYSGVTFYQWAESIGHTNAADAIRRHGGK